MINLQLGDCLDVMARIKPGSVDMVITDPPYGMAFQSNWSKTGPRHKKNNRGRLGRPPLVAASRSGVTCKWGLADVL